MIDALEKVGAFLLEHADLIDDIVEVIGAGTPKEAIKKAIRGLKIKISDEAMREELGLNK